MYMYYEIPHAFRDLYKECLLYFNKSIPYI